MSAFTLTAAPATDIWRKPPHTNIFNAPNSTPSTGPLPSFISAKATFSFPWTEQYDQAGLLLTFHSSSSSSPTSSSSSSPPEKWIKTGIEYYNKTPMLSTVSCDRWADWSVTPLPPSSSSWTTISIEKAGDEHGASLWVYLVDNDTNQKIPLREICWVYGDEDPSRWTLQVSAMAARPEKNTSESLRVEVKDLEVKWA
ncbi:hypothetical protein QBC47DRAFT_380486 [Echria macrotheca]|uniref:Uncharacterized protein n=1 Tax=Echria macrotheca TaxID=438768 RepID=A0AAJ0BGI7_9PEZI|nr:hypothetical protein QBC47DRAFT_380486 [Echria macrotheca]